MPAQLCQRQQDYLSMHRQEPVFDRRQGGLLQLCPTVCLITGKDICADILNRRWRRQDRGCGSRRRGGGEGMRIVVIAIAKVLAI